jgi:hypothetical protein
MDETSGSLLVSSPVVLGVNPVLLNTLFVVFIQIIWVVKEHVCHFKAYILLSVAGEINGGHLMTRLDIYNASDHPRHISHNPTLKFVMQRLICFAHLSKSNMYHRNVQKCK